MTKNNNTPSVHFKYDITLDAQNIIRSAKKQRASFVSEIKRLPKDLENIYRKIQLCPTESEAKNLARSMLRVAWPQIKQKIAIAREKLEPVWRERESEYFTRLAKLTQRPIYTDKLTAYFTTDIVCPFNLKKGWFMVSWKYTLESQIVSICHELLHMQFLTYYQDYCRKSRLTNDAISHLTEGLTILLNEEFVDLLPSRDQGYPIHHQLQEQLAGLWRIKRNFSLFLPAAIEITKNWNKKRLLETMA